MVKVRLVELFSGMVPAPKALVMEGGATTVRLAEAVLPNPSSLDVTALVVSFSVPAAMPCTFTEKVQDALGARVAPVKLIELDPAAAVIAPPPQLPFNPLLGVVTTNPAGRVSVNPTLLIEFAEVVLVTMKVKLVVPFKGMEEAPNAAVRVGAERTARLAVEVLPAPPFVEVTLTLLFSVPTVVPVTLTVVVHDAPGAWEKPVRDTLPEPAVAVIDASVQVVDRPFGEATSSPVGRLSVNAIPVSVAGFASGLAMLNFSVVVPLT
jgi:hypothetical protein